MTVASESPKLEDPAQLAEFSKFYEKTVPQLIAFLRYLGAPYAVAADCVQETMLKALPPKWGKLRNPHAWCRIVCQRLYVDEEVRRSQEDSISDFEGSGAALLSSEAEFLRLEEHTGVVDLMRKLAPQQRLAMACHYDGAGFKEIAELMGVTEATARSTYRHAKERVATLLAAEGQDVL